MIFLNQHSHSMSDTDSDLNNASMSDIDSA